MNFLNVFRHLLPNAKAWTLTINKRLRQFFDALGKALGDAVKLFFDLIWLDIHPDITRELTAWEVQWGLPPTLTDDQERRDRLEATWRALGGQSPRYIQDTLQAAGFNVFVHEWWELPLTTPPVPRDPTLYLRSGTTAITYLATCGNSSVVCGNNKATCGAALPETTLVQYLATCGAVNAQCNHADAICGASNQPTGFPLVNKLFIPNFAVISCGARIANCGNVGAICGSILTSYSLRRYVVSTDPGIWPYFLYIGGQNFPDHAIIKGARRNEFETLCLKICPTQQWLGMLITYS